jgi:eukaryotic-like serine/threonine-protein kinase
LSHPRFYLPSNRVVIQARLSRIGKYEVESVVGEGAMGVVYCALDSMLNRRVAIKVMSDAIAQDADLRERFLREAQAAGSLQHPNVVTIYDFGEVDGHLYIAMEYVEGDDLEDFLKAKIPLPLDAKLELIIDVLQGLAFAHKRGVVHRDIKPANIRVDREGKARIMDFGVAHLASSDMTRTGTMLGTPSYMAPEQIVGGPVTPETDIFSVGAVMYELLTQTRPFKGDTLQTLMYQILSTMPRPLGDVVPTLPPELNRVVMRALQKEPKDRYPHALEMANDLVMIRTSHKHDGSAASLSLRATIDSALAERHAGLVRVARRKRATTFGAGILAAVVVLGIGYEAWRLSQGDAPASTGAPIVSTSAAGTLTEPAAPLSPPVAPAAQEPTAGAPTSSTQSTPSAGVQRTSAPPKPAGPTREVTLALNVQRAAIGSRRRASEAGATSAQLQAGDSLSRNGELLLDRGRTVDAAESFNRAAASWTKAETAAREDAARRAAAESGPPAIGVPASSPSGRPSAPEPTLPPVPSPSVATVTAPPPAVALPKAPANPAPEINSVIASYARAIESRDITELRRVYPGMTTAQRTAFEDFFRATRSLHAALAVGDLQVDGSSAEARLSGTYEYVTTAGKAERLPVAFRATLHHDGNAWKLMVVR